MNPRVRAHRILRAMANYEKAHSASEWISELPTEGLGDPVGCYRAEGEVLGIFMHGVAWVSAGQDFNVKYADIVEVNLPAEKKSKALILKLKDGTERLMPVKGHYPKVPGGTPEVVGEFYDSLEMLRFMMRVREDLVKFGAPGSIVLGRPEKSGRSAIDLSEVAPAFDFVKTKGLAQIVGFYDAHSFGNAVVVMSGSQFVLRIVRDRSQIIVEAGSAGTGNDKSGMSEAGWYYLPDIIEFIDGSIEEKDWLYSPGIEALAQLLDVRWNEIAHLFASQREMQRFLEFVERRRAENLEALFSTKGSPK